MRKCNRGRASLIALALTAVPLTRTYAATTFSWITSLFGSGTGNNNWSTPGNWNPSGQPGNGDTADIFGNGLFNASVVYDYAGPAVTLNTLQLNDSSASRSFPTSYLSMSAGALSANIEYVGDSGSGLNGRGEIDQSGGTNTVGGLSSSSLTLAYNQSDTGTYNLSGSAILNANDLTVGNSGTATFNQFGGTGNYGLLAVNTTYGTGTYNLSGNGVINASDEAIGENGSGSGGGTLLQTGGVNKVQDLVVGSEGTGTYTQIGGATAVSDQMTVGDAHDAGSGIYNLEAGTLTANGIYIGAVGDGTFNQSGGTHTTTSITMGAAGVETGNPGDGQYNLSGGALIVKSSEAIAVDGFGDFTQSGGTNTDQGEILIPEPTNSGKASYSISGGSATDNGTQIGTPFTNGVSASGTLSITSAGTFTDSVGIVLDTNGTLALGGGTLNTVSIQVAGGTFNWTSGTLNITGAAGLTIDIGNIFGNSLTLSPGKNLGVTATLTNNGIVNSTSQIKAANIVNAGTFTSEGSLTVTGSFTNSGLAILGGTQTWAHGATFFNTAGDAAFQSDAGSAASFPLLVNISGGNVTLASPQHWAGVTISGGGILDIENESLIISYGASDPRATILSYLKSGAAGGSWTGSSGILSFAAAASNGKYGVGFADSSDPGNPAGLAAGQMEIKYALLGDANLDGSVNGSDFAILAANFNKAVSGWDQGDFNYDGSVNGADFADLAANFNQGSSQSVTAALDSFAATNGLSADVLEPASATMMVIGGLGILRRRRHGREIAPLLSLLLRSGV
jgi:hypothetical protein